MGQRGEDGPHELRRLRARRLGDPQRRHGRERRHGGAQRGRPRRRLARRCCATASAASRARPRLRKGAVLARRQARVPRRARRPRRPSAVQAVVRRGQRFTVSRAGRPGRAARPDPRRGTGSAPRSCAWADGSSARVPLVTATPVSEASVDRSLQGRERSRDPRRGRSVARWSVACCSWACAGGQRGDAGRCDDGRGGRRDHHGDPERRHRQVAVGAELPPRAAPPHRRAARRSRAARASTSRAR